MTVLLGIADPHDRPVGQHEAAPILGPGGRTGRSGRLPRRSALADERAILDLGAGEIATMCPLIDPSAAAAAIGTGAAHEVGRIGVDRHIVARLAGRDARGLRLVIAGREAVPSPTWTQSNSVPEEIGRAAGCDRGSRAHTAPSARLVRPLLSAAAR